MVSQCFSTTALNTRCIPTFFDDKKISSIIFKMKSYKNNNRAKGRVEPLKIPAKKKFLFQVTVTSLHFTKLDS